MTTRVVSLATTVILVGLFCLRAVEQVAVASEPPPYYLALGDSLSVGIQPDATGAEVATSQGYVDDLYALQRLETPTLLLAKLGCSGETTTTMILGGICPYPLGSQLNQAIAFMKTHHVVLVTIDIGADNVDGCLSSSGGIDKTCVEEGLTKAARDVPVIAAALRHAVDPSPLIVAANYYDPFLAAAWLQGPAGQALAIETEKLTGSLNSLLDTAYETFGIPVADVQTAFKMTDFQVVPSLGLPLNVLLACEWTWICAHPPVGPNEHANVIGYGVIASAFLKTLAGQGLRPLMSP